MPREDLTRLGRGDFVAPPSAPSPQTPVTPVTPGSLSLNIRERETGGNAEGVVKGEPPRGGAHRRKAKPSVDHVYRYVHTCPYCRERQVDYWYADELPRNMTCYACHRVAPRPAWALIYQVPIEEE